ncbi:MAG: menaquinone-dependent protoporphyrinogen IX dehydrogenase [Steroidobacteraceae bacterium]
MTRTLVAFSSVDGHTQMICERLRRLLEEQGHRVTLLPVEEAIAVDCAGFGTIVVGASIRYGRHRPSVLSFVQRHRAVLDRVPCAFFTVNAVARKPGKDTPAGNPYYRKFVRIADWSPALGAAFGGKIDYARYGLVDRLMIRFIMWLTNGPTDPKAVVEFTDWNAVDAFALQLCSLRAPPQLRLRD